MDESWPAGCLSERTVCLSDTFLPGSGPGSGGLASEDTALPRLWGDPGLWALFPVAYASRSLRQGADDMLPGFQGPWALRRKPLSRVIECPLAHCREVQNVSVSCNVDQWPWGPLLCSKEIGLCTETPLFTFFSMVVYHRIVDTAPGAVPRTLCLSILNVAVCIR